jgi:hypothetical protein
MSKEYVKLYIETRYLRPLGRLLVQTLDQLLVSLGMISVGLVLFLLIFLFAHARF